MKPEAIAKWEQTRAKGKTRFTLITGVLSYGLPMFLTMTFIAHRNDLSLAFVALSAVMWAIGGTLFGIAMWHIAERKYRKATQANAA